MTHRHLASLIRVALVVALAAPVPAWATRNSSGTYTLPSGNPVVSGTSISTTWANTTLADIASALTGSLSRSGQGGMSAPLQCTDGSVSFPAITFNNETTSGFYRIGTNDVALSIGGTKRLEQSSLGLTETGWAQFSGTITGAGYSGGPISGTTGSFSSSVGISAGNLGLTQGTAQTVFKMNGQLRVGTTDSNSLDLYTSNTSRLTIAAGGGIDAHSQVISNVTDPSSAQDAATMNWVQTRSAGQQVSTDSGAFTTASTTYVDVTNLSITITTRGRPVMLMLQSVGSASSVGYVTVVTTGGGGGGYAQIAFLRDSTVIGSVDLGSSNVATTNYFSLPIAYLDPSPTAASHTYKVQAKVTTGTPSVTIGNCVLVAYEL